MHLTLSGTCTKFEMFDKIRHHGTVQNLPFWQYLRCVSVSRFDGKSGRGQQRGIVDGQVKKLMKAMRDGEYTPVNLTASFDGPHPAKLVVDGDTFSIDIRDDEPLLSTDGQQRGAAIARLIEQVKDKSEAAEGREKEKLGRWLEQLENLPITLTIYFDGNPQRDFINIQSRKAVDPSHMFSLNVHLEGKGEESARKSAFKLARLMNKTEMSPYHNRIRFDSSDSINGGHMLPVKTLCATGASDLSTSLVGLLNVCPDMAVASQCVREVHDLLIDQRPNLVKAGMVLTPWGGEGASKGSATMLIGVAICLAQRLALAGRVLPDEDDLEAVLDAADKCLDKFADGNVSSQGKRKLMGNFASDFFSDMEDLERHDGLPIELLKSVSCSGYGCPPIPKASQTPKEPKIPKESKTPKVPKEKKVAGTPRKSKGEKLVAA